VIPFFQPEIRFVGLVSNFSHLPGVVEDESHQYFRDMVALIRAHRGDVMLLTEAARAGLAMQNLSKLNISMQSDRCQLIESKHEKHPLCLLPLTVGEP
jgi:hypothetical protein